ncbi:MAG: Arm DNA-binding domain-containing protein [Pseudoxanthomonas sp.]
MPNGAKYWRMKYRVAGREKRLTLGVYPEISLKRALVERDRARLSLYEQRDPSGEKRVAKLKARTDDDASLKNIAEEWLDGLMRAVDAFSGTFTVGCVKLV